MGDSTMRTKPSISALPAPIEPLICTLRGERVILDLHLAQIYGVPTKALNQAVKRNRNRFPPDFLIQLKSREWNRLRSQIVTSNGSRGGRRYFPLAFTEHGAIMAANVLRTNRAVQMSVFVVRAFVGLRTTTTAHRDLGDRLKELEQRVGQHDDRLWSIIETIRQLMTPPEKPRRRIGFGVEEPKAAYQLKRKHR